MIKTHEFNTEWWGSPVGIVTDSRFFELSRPEQGHAIYPSRLDPELAIRIYATKVLVGHDRLFVPPLVEILPDHGLSLLCLVRGKKHTGLDLDERGRHDEKLARHLQVHLSHQIEVSLILPGDVGDGKVEDVEFVYSNQVE